MSSPDGPDFASPSISLAGSVDLDMYHVFRDQLNKAPCEGDLVIELSTLGGDPEMARLMGDDLRVYRNRNPKCRTVFLGKATIYSAGVTFLSYFEVADRYLTRGTRLMIHERRMSKTVNLEGPLTTCLPIAEAAINEIRTSIAIQNEGFENLIRGSRITMDEILQKTPSNWYLDADEALERKLIRGIV